MLIVFVALLQVCVGSGVLVTAIADLADKYAVHAVNSSGVLLPYCASSADFQDGSRFTLDPVTRKTYWANLQSKLLFRAHVAFAHGGFECGPTETVCTMFSWLVEDDSLLKMWVDDALDLLIFVYSTESTPDMPCSGAEDCLVVNTVSLSDCNNPASGCGKPSLGNSRFAVGDAVVRPCESSHVLHPTRVRHGHSALF